MHYTILWLSEHRRLLLAATATFFWAAANYWYWHHELMRFASGNKPHSWSVDMASKTGTGGRKQLR